MHACVWTILEITAINALIVSDGLLEYAVVLLKFQELVNGNEEHKLWEYYHNKAYPQWRHRIKNGCHIGGTLMFSSTDAYREKILIDYNLLEKEDMAV